MSAATDSFKASDRQLSNNGNSDSNPASNDESSSGPGNGAATGSSDTATSAPLASTSLFRASKLSSFTDNLWTQRKTEAAASKSADTSPLDLLNSLKKSSDGDAKPSANPFLSAVNAPSGFVFGSRISDRVINAPIATTASTSKDASATTASDDKPSNTTSTAASTTASDTSDTAKPAEPATGFRALASGAASSQIQPNTFKTLSESSESAPKFGEYKVSEKDAGDVMTGEENETNIIQLNCKLHVFEAAGSNWHERAQGTLRLNERNDETGTIETRLVMRTTGSLRLVLNSKLFADMVLERVGPKRVRFSGTDVDTTGIQIFLITGSEQEISPLWGILSNKLEALKKAKPLDDSTGDRKRKANDTENSDDKTVEKLQKTEAETAKST